MFSFGYIRSFCDLECNKNINLILDAVSVYDMLDHGCIFVYDFTFLFVVYIIKIRLVVKLEYETQNLIYPSQNMLSTCQ